MNNSRRVARVDAPTLMRLVADVRVRAENLPMRFQLAKVRVTISLVQHDNNLRAAATASRIGIDLLGPDARRVEETRVRSSSMDELERRELQRLDARHAHLDHSTGGVDPPPIDHPRARYGTEPSAIRAVQMPL